MNFTAEQYADLVVANTYKVKNIYNLATAIAKVASKYAEWTLESVSRMDWATDGTEEHAERNELAQEEARVKREAYRLALVALTSELPK